MNRFDLSLMLCFTASLGAQASCQTVPGALTDYVNSLEVSYVQIHEDDLQRHLREEPNPGNTVIVADFNGDHLNDYALLAKNRGTYVSLLVFIGEGDGFSHHVLYDHNYGIYFNEHQIEEAIFLKEGVVRGPDETLNLKNPAIYSSAKRDLFYWDNGEFRRFLTED